MSKGSKIALGILSCLPIILVGVIIYMVFDLIPEFMKWDKYEPDAHEVIITMSPIFFTGLFAGIISLVLLIYYIIHLVNNKEMETGERVVWILAFLFAGVITYPVYWAVRIWNTKT
jgi:hypothetical protein